MVTSPSPTIAVEELPDFLQLHDTTSTAFLMRVGMTIAEAEKLLIRQTLTRLTSNREAAARALGISRRALQYKIKHYGLLD